MLDEADRMLDMGFLPTIQRIMAAMPTARQTLFFSATIENSVAHLVDTHVPNAVRIAVGSITKPIGAGRLRLYEVAQDRKLDLLRSCCAARRDLPGLRPHQARRRPPGPQLAVEGVKTAAIHGDRSQSQRNQALRGFQEGQFRVLVATDVAARGIHVDGIAHVVNYDLAQVPEDFIHRVGRTGRMGLAGRASTLGFRALRSASCAPSNGRSD